MMPETLIRDCWHSQTWYPIRAVHAGVSAGLGNATACMLQCHHEVRNVPDEDQAG